MAKQSNVATKTFFSAATRMSIHDLVKFFENVVFKMDPKVCPPIIVWSQPGLGKSQVLERMMSKHENGLKTVILSQLGALDANGLPGINPETGSTVFAPTETFGRGKYNLFLDELNNAAPSVQAMVQNLMSARAIGGDDYSNCYIIAACNPPTSNTLAADLPQPIMNRAMHIMLTPDLEDYMHFATNVRPQHPAIVAFHKSTSCAYLMTQWGELTQGTNFEIAEPASNEPFPTSRSWENASSFLSAATTNPDGTPKYVDWTLVRASIEGNVGIAAANKFAVSYAYAQSLPDIKAIFDGTLVAKGTDSSIVMQYMVASACLNYCITRIVNADNNGAKMDLATAIKTAKGRKESECYQLLAGISNCLAYIGTAASAEIATAMFCAPVSNRLRNCRKIMGAQWAAQLSRGFDAERGYTAENFKRYGIARVGNANDLADSLNESGN